MAELAAGVVRASCDAREVCSAHSRQDQRRTVRQWMVGTQSDLVAEVGVERSPCSVRADLLHQEPLYRNWNTRCMGLGVESSMLGSGVGRLRRGLDMPWDCSHRPVKLRHLAGTVLLDGRVPCTVHEVSYALAYWAGNGVTFEVEQSIHVSAREQTGAAT